MLPLILNKWGQSDPIESDTHRLIRGIILLHGCHGPNLMENSNRKKIIDNCDGQVRQIAKNGCLECQKREDELEI